MSRSLNSHPPARRVATAAQSHGSPVELAALRDVFWNNVVRDMLNSLAVLGQQQPELFDGRFAVLTNHGERIPIAQVFPMFACSIPGSQPERDASAAVQCTVFRIQTPAGEVFTLPVHEIRAMHSLTPELIEELQKASESEAETEGNVDKPADNRRPFGFGAFASLPKPVTEPAPDQPTE